MARLAWFFGIGLIVSLWHCANPIAPTGGPKDEDPPKIDSTRSTPNYQTNFTKQPITLTFDEWLKLDKPNQIVVSPPMRKKPTFTQRGKSIHIEWPEEENLLDSVTYTINFGDAIKDITEGNTLKDYRFVFATGPVLDSGRVEATITDALTLQPLENITVMLYVNTDDSIVYKEPPYYFAKTDKQGHCIIENIRPGKFKVFALEDGNQNYLFDNVNEKVGFQDSIIAVNDTVISRIHLKVFQQLLPYKVVRRRLYQNLAQLTFNRSPRDLYLESEYQPPVIEQELDTLRFWLDDSVPNPWTFYLTDSVAFRDTSVLYRDSTSLFEMALKIEGSENTTGLPAATPWKIKFNQPILHIDTNLIQVFTDDTLALPVHAAWDIDSTAPGTLTGMFGWKPDTKYRAQLLPGAIEGWTSSQKDTIGPKLRTAKTEDLANLVIQTDSLSPQMHYVVQLLSKETVIKESMIFGVRAQEINWKGLKPAEYELRIIADENANGVWDPGDYLKHRAPEKVQIQPIQNLRANWDLEIRFNWKSSGI